MSEIANKSLIYCTINARRLFVLSTQSVHFSAQLGQAISEHK